MHLRMHGHLGGSLRGRSLNPHLFNVVVYTKRILLDKGSGRETKLLSAYRTDGLSSAQFKSLKLYFSEYAQVLFIIEQHNIH